MLAWVDMVAKGHRKHWKIASQRTFKLPSGSIENVSIIDVS